MGRVLLLIVIVLIILVGLVVGGIALANSLRSQQSRRDTRSEQQRKEQTQRDLARFAPAVLEGSPLLAVIIEQGKQLEQVADILRGAGTGQDPAIYLPDDLATLVREWLVSYLDRKYQR